MQRRPAADDHRSAEAAGRGRRSSAAPKRRKRPSYDYNEIDLERQKKLYEEGVTSKQTYDQAVQAYDEFQGRLGIGEVGARHRSSANSPITT